MQSAECGIGARGNGGAGNAECGVRNAELGRGERSPQAMRFYCGALSSVCVWRCGSAATLSIGSRLAMRFWRDVLLSIYAIVCSSVVAFTVGSRLLFVSRQTGRLAESCVPIPPGRDRLCAFSQCRCGYLPLWVHFGFARFLQATRRVTGNTGKRGWRRGACASLRNRIGFEMLSAGSTLRQNVEAALRPPQTASKSRMWKRHCRLSGLSSRCGGLP